MGTTVIVGAGMSGRIAKLLCPEAVLLEASAEDKFRCALFVGPQSLYRRVECLNPKTYEIITGWDPTGFHDAEGIEFRIRPLNGEAMHRCQRKKMPWAKPGALKKHAERYPFRRDGWRAEIPEVTGVRWLSKVTSISPENRLVECVVADGVGGSSVFSETYEKLVWTGPLTSLMRMNGIKGLPATLEAVPLHYFSKVLTKGRCPGREQMYIEHVPYEGTPVYRRTVYVREDGSRLASYEAMDKPFGAEEGWETFWPGVIKPSVEAEIFVAEMKRLGIFCAGRFARWDPDEHIHDTEAYLRRVLR